MRRDRREGYLLDRGSNPPSLYNQLVCSRVQLVRFQEPHEGGEAEALREAATRGEAVSWEAIDEDLEGGALERTSTIVLSKP